MAPAYKLSGLILLVTAVLLPAACAYDDIDYERVTWPQCKRYGSKTIQRGDQNYGARILNLWHCGISNLDASDLEGLPNLRGINLYWNEIINLDPDVFRGTPDLLYLDVKYNKLEKIPVFGARSVLPNVYKLDFSKNKISKLDDPRTFSSTKQLQILNLNKNQIEYIHPDMFSGLTELETIQLEDNKLTNIADKTFALSSLEFVYLSNNLIANVDSGAFGGCRVISLTLNDNRLTKLPENFFDCAGVRLVSFCYHGNPWQCANLRKISARGLRCRDGPEPVCTS